MMAAGTDCSARSACEQMHPAQGQQVEIYGILQALTLCYRGLSPQYNPRNLLSVLGRAPDVDMLW